MKSEWSEYKIARAISLQTFNRKCLVLVDNCNWTGYECDVLAVTTDLRIIDVEVKISRADLKADAKKDKWWHRTFAGYGEREEVRDADGRLKSVRQPAIYNNISLTHPRKVWKHYYAMPKDIWKPELAESIHSKASGILLFDSEMRVECIRRASPDKEAYRLNPEQVMDIARLANLRMWEAYNTRSSAAQEAAYLREQLRSQKENAVS